MQQPAEPTIVLITLDSDKGEAVLTRSDGKEARWQIAVATDPTEMVARIHTTPRFRSLLAVTKTGDEVLLELPAADGAEPRGDRLAVYLDQNQWSTVANALHGLGKVDERDRTAALQLAHWASQGRIILPFSAGHVHETGVRFNNDKRYALGLTILQLSRGWQMRDPIQVRREELRASIIRKFDLATRAPASPVISLDPDALFGPQRGPRPRRTRDGAVPDLEFHLRVLTAAAANVSTMLDLERIEDVASTRWVSQSQRFSDWLDRERKDRQQKRKAVDAIQLADLSDEIAYEAAAAGATTDQLATWIKTGFGNSISEMPATGLFREMLHERHLNIGTTWRANDLTDMIYLSCAAGYCDFVVTERHMSMPLVQGVRRLSRRTRVHARLSDLVTNLAGVLPPTLEHPMFRTPFGRRAAD